MGQGGGLRTDGKLLSDNIVPERPRPKGALYVGADNHESGGCASIIALGVLVLVLWFASGAIFSFFHECECVEQAEAQP